VFVPFVELALALPLFASAASLLFHTVNDPMAFLISIVSFHTPPVFPVMPSGGLSHAVFAPILQSIFVFGLFAEFTFVFPLFAFTASLHF
jgi:hypothetical protein